MYSVTGHGNMIAERARTDAYARALQQAIRPGSVVLDLGTGTGFFALLACKFGARRVFAIESDDVIEVARRIAADNACGDRIELFHARSTEVTLPERADVIVSDLRGVMPLFQMHLPSIIDARRRFLARAGTLIPQGDAMWVACVRAPAEHRHVTTPWSDNLYGIDLRAARGLQANQWKRAFFEPEQLLTNAQCWARIDYASIDATDFDARVTLPATGEGEAHGYCAWFDSVLLPGIGFSNAPGSDDRLYGNIFFPWPEPVALVPGDAVSLRIRAQLVGSDYLWTWETTVDPKQGPAKARFQQSDFYGDPISPMRLRKRAADHVPALGDDGRIDAFVLELMSVKMPLGDIARRLTVEFPARFADWRDALTRVGELSARYGR
jgi:protein arginine N-methyltransferase 1